MTNSPLNRWCVYTHVSSFLQQKLKSADRYTYIERIQNLRMSSSKCHQYTEFWEKTAPLWDKMTVCLQASNAETSAVSGSSINKEFAEEQTRRQRTDLVDEGRPPTLVQEIMMNGIFIIYYQWRI